MAEFDGSRPQFRNCIASFAQPGEIELPEQLLFSRIDRRFVSKRRSLRGGALGPRRWFCEPGFEFAAGVKRPSESTSRW
jgi:hypothetical protein